MPDIEFACTSCRQVLECEAELAGETVDCPACGASVVIPLPGGVIVESAHACPHCDAPLEHGAVLCVQCGYHLKLGKKIETDLG